MDPVLSGRRSPVLRNIIFRVHSDFRKDISPGLSFHGRRGPASTASQRAKAKAMALCDAAEPGPDRPWKENKGLMAFLATL